MTNAIGESIYSISIWNIVNQLGKYDLSCESAVNNLKEKHFFLNQMTQLETHKIDLPVLCKR